MKKVLLLGRLEFDMPNFQKGVSAKDVKLFGGSSIEDVKSVFDETDAQIDIVIMGAGIDLEKRLEIVEYIFNASKGTSVHMKDKNSGRQGMLPFVNNILNGLTKR